MVYFSSKGIAIITTAWVAMSLMGVAWGETHEGKADFREILKYGKLNQAAYDLTQNLPFGYVLLDKIYAQDPTNNLYQDIPVGFIARSAGKSADLVVVFGSTENSSRWLQDSDFRPSPSRILPGSGLIVGNFETLYRAARTGSRPSQSVIVTLREIVKDGHFSSLHLVGHGFGAIFATLLALDFSQDPLAKKLFVYTFASPRVGDLAFSHLYNHLVPNTWRIHNRLDILTKTPPPLLFFHVGDEVEVIGHSRFDLRCESDLPTYLNALDPNIPVAKNCAESAASGLVKQTKAANPTEGFLERIAGFYSQAKKYWPVTAALTTGGTALGGICALLLLAWSGGAPGISKSWLIRKSSTLMLAVPGFGRWALFLGYKSRLMANKSVKSACETYFGIGAYDPRGHRIPADISGDALHCAVTQALRPQEPVLLIGSGGAGKSTLLSRFAVLAIRNELPEALKGYTPILVPAENYTDSLIKAITATLRERDGIGLTDEMAVAQLQSGKFLVLFDGLTEVTANDKTVSTTEIIRTARNSDYSSSRFIFSTRSSENLPPDIPAFQLQPMEWEFVEEVLSLYELEGEAKKKFTSQIRSVTSASISPLLFNMTITMMAGKRPGKAITSRASLYEAYCRRLLKIESEENIWRGWRTGLEQVARWFLLETGKRGVGLAHVALIDKLEGRQPILTQSADGKTEPRVLQAPEDITKTLKRLYGLEIEQASQLLQRAETAGILVGGRRWRFVHDTFEEYFAASYLLSEVIEADSWPELEQWNVTEERQQDFLGVVEFVSELANDSERNLISSLTIPTSWKRALND